MEQITERVRSLDIWSRTMQMNSAYQNKGLLEVGLKPREHLTPSFLNKIKGIDIHILIKYDLSAPVAGIRFRSITLDKKGVTKYAINDNKV